MSVAADGPAPLASVVLPTHGRRDSLLRTLRALARQTAPPEWYEVIVVCDGDVDGSYAACTALLPTLPYRLVLVRQRQQGPAAARNRGIAEAAAPLIAFIDDDVVPIEGWLSLHLAAHRDGPPCVTIGPLLPPLDARLSLWGTWEERTLCRQYEGMQSGAWAPTYRQFYTGNAAVPKEQLLAAGGFDPSYRRAEDVEIAIRMGERGLGFRFLPAAEGRHYVQRRFAAWARSATAYGAADVRMASTGRPWILALVAREFQNRHPSVRLLTRLVAGRPPLLVPVAMVLGWVVRLADRWQLPSIGIPCCSLLFNLRYYVGLVDALGGRAAIRTALSSPGKDAARLRR